MERGGSEEHTGHSADVHVTQQCFCFGKLFMMEIMQLSEAGNEKIGVHVCGNLLILS